MIMSRAEKRGMWVGRGFPAVLVVGLFLAALTIVGRGASAQRPATDRHVAELGRYLNGVKIASPLVYRRLAVYPVLVEDVPLLRGRWLTADDALARGVLVVSEKAGGDVPTLWAENRSRDWYVFIMTGEVVAGGMQTRTVRQDVVLAPGQKIDLAVFCVEAHRWSGEARFSAGSKTMVPQSIQGEMRKGGDQAKVWSEVARNNASLNAENATGSLEQALNATPVREKIDAVRRHIVPDVPRGTTGFIFLSGGRAVGAELFGSEAMARSLLPKLLDSYAVDYVLLRDEERDRDARRENRVAIDFFEDVCRAGSQRATSPGSGSGIRTRSGNLLGDGVSLDGVLAHYGVQVGTAVTPPPGPKPLIIYPNQQAR
jgi:hypothetical protein